MQPFQIKLYYTNDNIFLKTGIILLFPIYIYNACILYILYIYISSNNIRPFIFGHIQSRALAIKGLTFRLFRRPRRCRSVPKDILGFHGVNVCVCYVQQGIQTNHACRHHRIHSRRSIIMVLIFYRMTILYTYIVVCLNSI